MGGGVPDRARGGRRRARQKGEEGAVVAIEHPAEGRPHKPDIPREIDEARRHVIGRERLHAIGMRDGIGRARHHPGATHAEARQDDLFAGDGHPVGEGPEQAEVQEERLAVRAVHRGNRPLVEELVGEVVREGDRLVRIGEAKRRVADEVQAWLEREVVRVQVVLRESVAGVDRPEARQGDGAPLRVCD